MKRAVLGCLLSLACDSPEQTSAVDDSALAETVDTLQASETVEDSAALETTATDVMADSTEPADIEPPTDIAPEPDVVADVIAEEVTPAPTFPKACPALYDPAKLPTFTIAISDEEWDAMRDDCSAGVQQYRPIQFGDGSDIVAAQLRLKGNWSWSCDKLQFVVSFNEVDKDNRFRGLRKMVFDAPWYDPTLIRERLAMDFLGRYGAPYSCINNARVLINGEFYGVYANIERLDHEYLERHFDDPDGNLYQAGRELKTNEDVGDTSDIDAYWGADSVAELGAIVDLQHAVKVWAGEAMIPDLDGYWAGVDINWYIYNHPARGFLYLTYDADISFAENIWPDAVTVDPILWEHEGWGREPQQRMVLSDTVWCEAFVAALTDARAAYDVPLMQQQIDTWAAQIRDQVEADPHKTFGFQEHLDAIAALRVFVAERAAFVDDWLTGDHCPIDWGD